MLPLIAFSAASFVPCAGDTSGHRLLYGATLFVDDERPSKPRRSAYRWSLANSTAVSQRVLHRTALGDSTSSTGTGAIAASAM
ncbi:hypothetical protein JB92DRAFT_3013951 [Gautieria morchelliformis]|nr:hypothetical protein JB92DRAFT_3013951 [Gautieria morchelliformis]